MPAVSNSSTRQATAVWTPPYANPTPRQRTYKGGMPRSGFRCVGKDAIYRHTVDLDQPQTAIMHHREKPAQFEARVGQMGLDLGMRRCTGVDWTDRDFRLHGGKAMHRRG